MNNSKRRHAGGAYRRMKTMVTAHAKEGKDRRKARRHTKTTTTPAGKGKRQEAHP